VFQFNFRQQKPAKKFPTATPWCNESPAKNDKTSHNKQTALGRKR
jgi:hypothetical protein